MHHKCASGRSDEPLPTGEAPRTARYGAFPRTLLATKRSPLLSLTLCAPLLLGTLLAACDGDADNGAPSGQHDTGPPDLAPAEDGGEHAGTDVVARADVGDSGSTPADSGSASPDSGSATRDGGPQPSDTGSTSDLGPESETPVDPSYVFDTSEVPEIHLTVDPADLARLYTDEGRYSDEYRPAAQFRFVKGGETHWLAEVGFRARGNTSRDKAKLSYKLSFNEYHRGRRFFGLRRMNLNADTNDPTFARRYLSHYLLRQIGVPTSLVNHVRLYINGTYMGLYVNTEHIDETFLARVYPDASDGPLYKCLWPAALTQRTAASLQATTHTPARGDRPTRPAYEPKTDAADEAGWEPLAELTTLLSSGPDAAALGGALAVEDYAKALAVTVLIGHWDGYWCNRQNYYLYRHPGDGRWRFLVYDTDNTFGIDYIGYGPDWDLARWAFADAPGWAEATPATRPLVAATLGVHEDLYRQHIAAIAARFFDPESPEYLGHEAERVQERIRSAALDDANNPEPYLDNRYSSSDGDMSGWQADDFERGFGTSYRSQAVKYGIEGFVQAIHGQVTAAR